MKWALIAAGALCALALALLAVLPYLVDLPQIQAYVAQSAAQALGRPVRFSSLSLSVLPLPALLLKDLEVAEDPRFGQAPFLRVGAGRLRLRLATLLRGRVEFAELRLERPRMEVIQDAAGRWNVASLGDGPPGEAWGVAGGPASSKGAGRGAAAAAPVLSRVQVVDGALHYQVRPRHEPARDYRVEGMRLAVEGLGSGAPVAIEGEAQLSPGAVLVKLAGTLSPPPGTGGLAAAPIRGELSLEAKDMAALAGLLLGPSPTLGGPIKGKLALTGTLGRPALAGQLDSGLLTLTERRPGCPPPETRRLTLERVRFPLTYDPARLTSRPLSASLSGGSVTLSLALAWEPAPLLSLKEITIRALPLGPVLVDYLCERYAVSGPLDLTGEISARPGDPWRTLAGQGELKVGAGRVVGPAALALLHSLFSSPLDFKSITGTYRIADGRLTTDDLLYTSERMTVAAVGQYALADGRLSFDLTMAHGRGQIKAKVAGTAASPSIRLVSGTVLRADPERLPGRVKKFLEGLTR